MKRRLAAALLLSLALSNAAYAQFGNASVAGFVQDASGAYIPGVSITAANTQTGVVTTVITNESGSYNIPSLLPGTYKLSAELPGFKSRVFNEVQLGANSTGRYNFTLEVGAVTDSVEVTAERTSLIAEASPTISQRLQFRIDATNIFNHPLMGTPNLSLNSTTPFGNIQTKGTQRRQFKAQLRFDF